MSIGLTIAVIVNFALDMTGGFLASYVYVEALNYTSQEPGYMFSIYKFVGFFGVIVAGYTSDRLLDSKRFPVVAVMLFLMAIVCFIQPMLAGLGMLAIGINIGLIGIMTYGPDSILCRATAMDIGGKRGAAMAAGIINGVGFAGQLLSHLLQRIFLTSLDGIRYFMD